MNERTRIVCADIALRVLGICSYLYLLRHPTPEFDWRDFDPRSAAVSGVETICYQYLSEHEPLASCLNGRLERLAFSLSFSLYRRSRDLPSEESAYIGSEIGSLLYRIAFGVVFDLPEARLRRWSSSPAARIRSRLERVRSDGD